MIISNLHPSNNSHHHQHHSSHPHLQTIMATSPQMYDTGLESLKKAALTVKVRTYLNASSSSDVDPADLENPELSLDLQSLIDDPNFEVGEGLFPELLHEKHVQAILSNNNNNNNNNNKQPSMYNNNGPPQHNHIHSTNGGNYGNNGRNLNPLAYMPQPVHSGSMNSTTGNNNGVNSTTSSNGSDSMVKEEPTDGNGNFGNGTVSSSEQSSGYSYSNPLSNVTSPSSSSSSQGYSPNAYSSHHHHHLPGHHGPDSASGLIVTAKNGSNGLFNSKGIHHPHHSHGPNSHHSTNSKKLKNVDKASDEYKRRRERNNIAVRKSREKAKIRSRETEERVKILCKENDRLQKKIELLTEELTFLRSFFSNVGGIPEQIHREFNKHLETFQHHHLQNGIHLQ